MKIEKIQHGTVLVLVPDGALIEEDAPEFAERVRECLRAGSVRVIIQMDSVGLETLLALYGEALALGGELKISAPTEIGRDILKATRLDHVIEVHDATPEARKTFV